MPFNKSSRLLELEQSSTHSVGISEEHDPLVGRAFSMARRRFTLRRKHQKSAARVYDQAAETSILLYHGVGIRFVTGGPQRP